MVHAGSGLNSSYHSCSTIGLGYQVSDSIDLFAVVIPIFVLCRGNKVLLSISTKEFCLFMIDITLNMLASYVLNLNLV